MESKQKESNKSLWITGIIIAFLVIGLITNGFGLFGPKSNNTVEKLDLSIGDSPVLGNINAPVTVYMFSDFSCPYCAASAGYNEQVKQALRNGNPGWEPAVPGIIENYVETGKAKLVFKYAAGHGAGRPALLVALALEEQNLFWEFHDLAFENQQDVSDIEKMKDLAKSLNANMTQLQEFLDSNKANFLIQQDIQSANTNGVTGTPTYFIDDQVIEGAQSYSAFKKILDSKL